MILAKRFSFPLEPLWIPLRGNSIYILFISSTRLGIFKLNFYTLIKCSEETFLHPYAQNPKNLHMHNFWLLFFTYYRHVSWHSISWKLTLKGYPLINGVTRWRHNVVAWLFNVYNFLVEMSTFKLAIKLTFGRNKFDKRTVQYLQTRIYF